MTSICETCGCPQPDLTRGGRPRRFCSQSCAAHGNTNRVRDTRAADVQWLLAAGESPHAILTRLDVTPAAMARSLHRAGRHDLAHHVDHIDWANRAARRAT